MGRHSEGYLQNYYQRNKTRLSANQKIRRQELRKLNPFIGNLRTTKANAKKAGVPFDLEPFDLKVPLTCPYLGIPLFWSSDGIKDNTPSIDRIIPKLGYVKENVQVISHLANAMKNKATVKQLLMFAKNVLEIHGEKP